MRKREIVENLTEFLMVWSIGGCCSDVDASVSMSGAKEDCGVEMTMLEGSGCACGRSPGAADIRSADSSLLVSAGENTRGNAE